ncbi:MAG TPA: CCA tRNA nucleotidyltransferase, partial [Dongiaceae bacterium]|nr:CCA tRNA nucleotidyltransferase [Dongiaceae bacterium]
MKPAGRLVAAAWMHDGPAQRLFAALDGAGVTARFVGGCVRNTVAGRAIDDIDLAVDKPPKAMMAALEAADLKVIPTGMKHGTVTAIADGRFFELTTLRRDVETDGRRAVVAFTDDWLEDAARRDFTFNALYADRDGTLYDPFDGRADLAAGRVRFIGDPDQRIAEDYLRILRFFRIHAAFGAGEPDREGYLACIRGRAGLASLSAERMRMEMLKLLVASGASAAAL